MYNGILILIFFSFLLLKKWRELRFKILTQGNTTAFSIFSEWGQSSLRERNPFICRDKALVFSDWVKGFHVTFETVQDIKKLKDLKKKCLY